MAGQQTLEECARSVTYLWRLKDAAWFASDNLALFWFNLGKRALFTTE